MRLASLLFVAAALAGFAANAAADDFQLPAGPNRDLVYGKCRTCHDLQYVVESKGITRDNWAALISDMGQYGLEVSDDDRAKIVEYLATYMGPHPPKAAPAAPAVARAADGRTVFERQCSACHQPDGKGLSGSFPPLAGNTDIFVERLFPVYVVLNGLQGAITVEDMHFQGVMPSFSHLSDAEIAAVIGYVRSAWGNDRLRPKDFAEVDAQAVAAARNKPMQPSVVHAYRQTMKEK